MEVSAYLQSCGLTTGIRALLVYQNFPFQPLTLFDQRGRKISTYLYSRYILPLYCMTRRQVFSWCSPRGWPRGDPAIKRPRILHYVTDFASPSVVCLAVLQRSTCIRGKRTTKIGGSAGWGDVRWIKKVFICLFQAITKLHDLHHPHPLAQNMAEHHESTSGSKSSGVKRKRPTNNTAYLPWNVQEKIKRRRVEEMKMRSSYSKERKKALGTGANTGVVDSGWPRKPKTMEDAGGRVDGVSKAEAVEAVALDMDRRPAQLQLPAPKPKKEPKPKPLPPAAKVGASIRNPRDSQETLEKSKPEGSQVVNSDGPRASNKDDGPSFREQKRAAYSRGSLHTYKSRSMKDKHGERQTKSGSVHGGGKKGQPNMKLRMGVMLEQIKRVTAS